MRSKSTSARLWSAFKNVAILFSFSLNVLVLAALILVSFWVIPVMNQLAKPLVGDLTKSLDGMVSAHIVQNIEIDDQIPISFDLPISVVSNAEIMQAVPMAVNTSFALPANGGTISGTVHLELPPGTQLPVALNVNVPVSQTIPIKMVVAVDIPLGETGIGPALLNLKGVLDRFDQFMSDFPASNREFFQRITTSDEQERRPESQLQIAKPIFWKWAHFLEMGPYRSAALQGCIID